MNSLTIASLSAFLPFGGEGPTAVFFVNLWRTKENLYTCTAVIVKFERFYLLVAGSIGFVTDDLARLQQEIDSTDPDYGSYISITASIIAGDIGEGAEFQSVGGSSKLARIPGLGPFNDFKFAIQFSSPPEYLQGLPFRPVLIELLSNSQRVSISLIQQGRFQVEVNPGSSPSQ